MTDPRTLDNLTVLALTIYGEARGESTSGREAVANVILNRAALRAGGVGPASWGRSVADICLARLQFSSWNDDDPNRAKMLAMVDPKKRDRVAAECFEIAATALDGALVDNTHDADHYLVSAIANRTKWAKGKKPVAVIGAHSFYKFYSLPSARAVQPPAQEADGASRQDAGFPSSSPAATPHPSPPEPSGSILPGPTASADLPPSASAGGGLSRQPDQEPDAPDEPEPFWRSIIGSKRVKAGVTLAAGSQVPGWVDTAWEKFTDWFKSDPDAVQMLWNNASTFLTIKVVGYLIFAAGAAWLIHSLWVDRKKGA